MGGREQHKTMWVSDETSEEENSEEEEQKFWRWKCRGSVTSSKHTKARKTLTETEQHRTYTNVPGRPNPLFKQGTDS